MTNSDLFISLRRECLASLQAAPADGVELLTNAGSGPTPSACLAAFDPASRSLKTRQLCLALSPDGPSQESSVSWPVSGMMLGGSASPLEPLVQGIAETVCGLWLPTPCARDWKDVPGMAKSAGDRNRNDMLARRIYILEASPPRSGIINPAFCLWFMGFPGGWLSTS